MTISIKSTSTNQLKQQHLAMKMDEKSGRCRVNNAEIGRLFNLETDLIVIGVKSPTKQSIRRAK